MRNLSAIYSNEQYKSLNATARDVFFLIYNQFTLSKKSVSEGKTGWRDDNGIFCYLGQKEIANILGKTDRTVRRAIEALKKAKLITVIERGAKRKAKLYVHEIVKAVKSTPVEIENQQVKEVFEETFGECANNSEAKALNNMAKSTNVESLVEAIQRSKSVEKKKSRISYITKALNSVIKDQDKPEVVKQTKYKKVIRKEQKPNWLKEQSKHGDGWDEAHQKESINKEKTRDDLSKIEYMEKLHQQILSGNFNVIGGNL